MKDETPEQAAARRAADAQRKRAERARKKLEAETQATQEGLNAVETIQDFWAISLRGLDVAKLAGWKLRQEYVEALLGDIRTVLERRAPDDQFIDDVDEELRADIKEHGVAGVTVPLLIGPFWKNPELLAKLTSGDDTPSTIFARFGILTAVDDFNLHKWDTFIAAHRRSKQPRVETSQVFYVSLHCSSCSAPPMAVSSAVAEAYGRTKQYLCGNCLSKAAKLRNFTQEQRSPDHAIFDGWGRVKDNERP
jgi:hypothetical protein